MSINNFPEGTPYKDWFQYVRGLTTIDLKIINWKIDKSKAESREYVMVKTKELLNSFIEDFHLGPKSYKRVCIEGIIQELEQFVK